MSRAVMQQALEALQERYVGALRDRAIEALEQALAEPGSDYERGFVDGMSEQVKRSVDKAVNRMAEPEQRGWFTIPEVNEWAAKLPQTTHWEGCEAVHPECRKPEQEPVAYCTLEQLAALKLTVPSSDKIALYTAPTPRQWVSLTEQEMYDLFFHDQYGPRLPEYLVNTIKCIEAALKEKNNG